MAATEILEAQGVGVREVAYLSRAMVSEPDTTTLTITLPSSLSDTQIDSILEYPGDLVFVGISPDLIRKLDEGLAYRDGWEATHGTPGCSDEDAIAAGRITAVGPRVRADSTSDATVCFANPEGNGAYVVIERDGRRILLITDPTIAMNEHLVEDGNAALVLRALGKHRNLVWYVGAFDDTTNLTYTGSPSGPMPGHVTVKPGFLPAGTGDALFALAIAGLVAAVWKGRRMGPLLREPLPIVVHASESARGRGRLYRRARAYGRASAALRAAAAERMGHRLGVPRTADAEALIAALTRACHRDPAGIERLLFGPPPESEGAMMDLATELDALEKEVHRP
jgi:hypothetical protein